MKKIILIFLLCVPCYAQRFAFNDKWNSTNGELIKYDKVEHCVGSAFLHSSIMLCGKKNDNAFMTALIAGFAWEVKDSMYDYEQYGKWGGEGFSFKDFAADVVGIYISAMIWEHVIKRK